MYIYGGKKPCDARRDKSGLQETLTGDALTSERVAWAESCTCMENTSGMERVNQSASRVRRNFVSVLVAGAAMI